MTGSADPRSVAIACARSMWRRDRATQGLDMVLESVGPGAATVSMPVREDMINGHDTCHGGFIFTLADSAFAFACNSYDVTSVAAACDIAFVRAARRGDRLTAVAHEVHREGRNGVYDVTVSNGNGDTIALFRGRSRTIGGPVIREEGVQA